MNLNIGCGNEKRRGEIGIDSRLGTQADIFYTIENELPFFDNVFVLVKAIHAIEHLDNIPKIMEEIWRVTKPDGTVIIEVPYERGKWNATDPTHKHPFNEHTLDFLKPGHKCGYYSKARFRFKTYRIRGENPFNVLALRFIMKPIKGGG